MDSYETLENGGSILLDIKKLVGLDKDYNAFDQDLIIFINTVLGTLNQLGVGPKKPVVINDSTTEWSELLGNRDFPDMEMVKSYMYLKVRLLFDPPSTGVLHEAMERQISELEWRINVQAETPAYQGMQDLINTCDYSKDLGIFIDDE